MTQSKKSNLHEDLTFGSYPPRPSVVNITKLEKLFSVWLQQFTEDGNFLKEEFGDSPVQIKGKVLIAELSGSESIIHFQSGDIKWVSLSTGIHPLEVGADAELHMDVNQFLYFDQNSKLINHV